MFEELNELAQRLHTTTEIKTGDERQLLVSLYFCRVLGHAQAAFICAERGMEPQADVLLRAALEAIFSIGAAIQDPSIVKKLLLDDDCRRFAFIRGCLALSEGALSASSLKKEVLRVEECLFGSDQRKLLIQKTKSENSGRLEALEACFWWQKRNSKDQLQRHVRCLDACFQPQK